MTNSSDPPLGDDVIGRHTRERLPRYNVLLNAVVERFGSGGPTSHRVRDLSAGGVRIDQAGDIDVGATVLVSVDILEAVGATVVWVKDGLAGLRFAQLIDPDGARAKAAIAPRLGDNLIALAQPVVQAGWMPNLRNPYRK